jgi:hypothetical protein
LSNELSGHETALMAAFCQEWKRRSGAGDNNPFIIDDFLDEHFPGGGPHGFMRDALNSLIIRGFLIEDKVGQTVRLTPKGIDHCNNNVQG